MSTLGKAVILFGADTAMFRGDVGRAVHIFESGMNRMAKAAFGFKSTLGAGAVAVAMAAMTKQAIDQADELNKLSSKTGRHVSELSALKYQTDLANVSNEQFQKGLIEWNKTLVQASDSTSRESRLLKTLGVDIKAGPTESLRQFADAFAKVTDQELRASIASVALKKAGESWIPVLEQGSRGMDEAAEKARGLGIIISEDFAKRSEKFNDDLRTLTKSSEQLGIALAEKVVPALGAVIGRLAEAATQGRLAKGSIEELGRFGGGISPGSRPMDGSFGFGLLGVGIEVMRARNTPRPGGSQADVRRADLAMMGDVSRSGGTVDPDKVRQAIAETEALQKRQLAALAQMEQRRARLFELNEQELMLERIKSGTFKDFDRQTKTKLMDLAREIDLRNQHVKAIELGQRAHEAEASAMEHGADVFRDFALAGRARLDQLELELNLVGTNGREQEKLVAMRQLELDLLQRKRQAAAAYGDDVAGLMVEVARLDAEAARQRADVLRLIDERQAAERHWLTGALAGFDEYSDAATNAAANARDAVLSTFAHMEDALVSFVRRGKVDFRSLADSIIADMVRIFVRQQITGPLAQAGAMFLFGGGAGAGGGSAGAGDVLGVSSVAMAANGGVMTARGMVPLARYQAGGIANRPQLAMFGEGSMAEAFVPLPDGRRIPVALQGRGGGDVYHIDARGADDAAIRRLEGLIVQLNGSIEQRAIAANQGVALRGGARGRALRGGTR